MRTQSNYSQSTYYDSYEDHKSTKLRNQNQKNAQAEQLDRDD